VRIVNDTGGVIVAKLCKETCDAITRSERLDPGDGFAFGFHLREYVPRWYVLQDTDGRTIGCVAIPVPDPAANSARIDVLASQAVPCPADAFPTGTPPDPSA
jgi:hypothetical protein